MKMKKWTLWLLILALVVSLTACSVETPVEEDEDDDKMTVQEDVSKDEKKDDDKAEEKSASPAPALELTFEEFVAIDNEECTITITEIDPDGMWGYTVKAILENKSADKTYMFAIDNASVDGVSSDPFWAMEVAPGKKMNAEINFSDSILEELGLSFTDIQMTFRVYDTNDWSADPVVFESVHVWPYGQENAALYVREPQEGDLVLVDNEYVTFIVTSIDPDGYMGYTLKAYLENKSGDTTYMMSVDDASIDGLVSDPFWAEEVAPGTVAFADIYFGDDMLEELDLAFSHIEMTFEAYDSNDLSSDYVTQETVHIYPNGEEAVTTFVREPQEGDVVLVDNEYVTFIVTGYETDDIWGYSANVFMVNKTDTEVMFTTDDVSVNGFMCDPYWAKSVGAGKCAYGSISWSSYSFDANGITAVEEIELKLSIYDNTNYFAPKYVEEFFTLVP